MFATKEGNAKEQEEEAEKGIIGSSGSKAAEQDRAAWLEEVMIALLRRTRGTWRRVRMNRRGWVGCE